MPFVQSQVALKDLEAKVNATNLARNINISTVNAMKLSMDEKAVNAACKSFLKEIRPGRLDDLA